MNGSSGIQSANGGAMPFTTTHWSVVLEAQGETPAAQRALEILCRTYWRPLFGFVRRHGLGREEAQDLVQEFFARLLEHRNLDTVRREKGRLRSYLLVSLKRFLATERHRASGVKRYESGPHIPLDELLESEVAGFELAETWSADRLYERHWALAVLEQVLGRCYARRSLTLSHKPETLRANCVIWYPSCADEANHEWTRIDTISFAAKP